MDRKFFNGLKKRYEYASWEGRKTLDENLFVRNVILPEDILPDWQLQRIQRVSAPLLPKGAAKLGAQMPEPLPPMIQSLWSHRRDPSRASIKVEIYECTSTAAAHEFLVRVLGEYQLPEITRQDELSVGDIAFADPNQRVLAFARANLVHVIGNAGKELRPVAEIARRLDQELIRKPDIPAEGFNALAPEVEFRRVQAKTSPVKIGTQVDLEVNVVAPAGQEPMYKFFSRSGEIQVENERLEFLPRRIGEQDIEIFAIAPNHTVVRKAISFNAK